MMFEQDKGMHFIFSGKFVTKLDFYNTCLLFILICIMFFLVFLLAGNSLRFQSTSIS